MAKPVTTLTHTLLRPHILLSHGRHRVARGSPNGSCPLDRIPVRTHGNLVSATVILLNFAFFATAVFTKNGLKITFDFDRVLTIVTLNGLLLNVCTTNLNCVTFGDNLGSILVKHFYFNRLNDGLDSLVLNFARVN